MFHCRSCQRYLRSANFSLAASTHLSSRCRGCVTLDNIARSRDDFSFYKNILQRLRDDEQQLNRDNKIPFLLQVCLIFSLSQLRRFMFYAGKVKYFPSSPLECLFVQVEDMQYLVEVIWALCSAFNGGGSIYNLVFVRWDRRRDWSPWNCILLSKEETSAHLEVQDVTKVCQYLPSSLHQMTNEKRGYSKTDGVTM